MLDGGRPEANAKKAEGADGYVRVLCEMSGSPKQKREKPRGQTGRPPPRQTQAAWPCANFWGHIELATEDTVIHPLCNRSYPLA